MLDLWRWDGVAWAWVFGSNQVDFVGVYGTKGIPDPLSAPGSRQRLSLAFDRQDNLWLFGGQSGGSRYNGKI